MRERRAFKRVYWSGAMYFFDAEFALRENGTSLDQVVTRFIVCCRNDQASWSGLSLAKSLDKAAGHRVFEPLYHQYEASRSLPDYKTALAKLGIQLVGGVVTFTDERSSETLRRSLTEMAQ
jgi:hypothetical protein